MSENNLYKDMQDFNNYLREQIEDKNKEIERLTELCNKYEEEHKIVYEIWKKDISLYASMVDRINKAIEYINSDEMLKLREEFEYCNDKDLFDDFVGHLDRILRGSDKE